MYLDAFEEIRARLLQRLEWEVGKSVMSCPGAVEPITRRQQPCASTPADVPWCICTILPFPPKITLSHSNASFHILNFLNLGLEILSEQAISIRGKLFMWFLSIIYQLMKKKMSSTLCHYCCHLKPHRKGLDPQLSESFPAALTDKWEMTAD